MSYNDKLNKSVDDICRWLFSDIDTNAPLYVSYLKTKHVDESSFQNVFNRNSIVYTYSAIADKNSREYLSYSTASEDNIDTIEIVKIGYSRPEDSNLSHLINDSDVILFISRIVYLDGTIKNVYVYEAKFRSNFDRSSVIINNEMALNVVCNWNLLNVYLRDYKLDRLLYE